jgi:feruloyl-CoA synthase
VTPGYWNLPEANAAAFDEEGYFRTGDAVRYFDAERPELGLIFDGRLGEDFKLSTGTWVDVAGLQKHMRSALLGLAIDVVIAAPDRDYLGLVVFPAEGQNYASAGYRRDLRERIVNANGAVKSSSRRIAAAVIADEPASAAEGELTEKGSVNSRLVLSRRQSLVDRLYDPADNGVIRL